MLKPGGLQHVCVLRHHPGCLRAVGVLAAEAQAGQGCDEIQLAADLITAGDREFIGAQRGKTLLCIDIERSRVFQ